MTAPDPTPVTVSLARSDLGYIVDALMDAGEKRRGMAIRSGMPDGLHARIADHVESLALLLHDAQPDRIEAGRTPPHPRGDTARSQAPIRARHGRRTVTADLPVQDLIADVIEDAYDAWRVHPAEVAAAVVAAIQGATVEQQAELLGDDVVGGYQTGSGIDMADLSVLGADGEYHRGPYRRVIGPWREDPA